MVECIGGNTMEINLDTMKIIDISMPVTRLMPVYKGKESKRPNLYIESDFTTGSAYESKLEMNMHTGTHIDRSLHIIPGGTTIETLELSKVITSCKVIDFTDVGDKISREQLKSKNIKTGDFILLKTRNSYMDILETDFIFLDKSGAEYLKEMKIKGVGTDGLGIERSQPQHETHIQLLSSDIIILEGLRLKDIEEGEYILIAAPINIVGSEAAPVRAILLQ